MFDDDIDFQEEGAVDSENISADTIDDEVMGDDDMDDVDDLDLGMNADDNDIEM